MPQEELLALGKEDPALARLGGINGTNCQRIVGHKLSEAGGVSCNALGEQFKVSQVIAEVVGDAHTVLVGMGEAKLKGTKEARTAGDGSAHEVEFTKDPLPCLDADMLLATEVIEDGKDPCFVVVSEFECALGGIEHPAQDFFSLHPAAIPFQHFLF